MSKEPQPIRSYQRIFRPERRIYQLEGHPLPVPGGVPLRWLAYAAGSLAAVLLLGSGSPVVLIVLACLGAIFGAALGGGVAAAMSAGAGALAGGWIAGGLLGLLDWPLRLVVLPFALATLATQATPDGRGADRFACSWLALRMAPGRRSLGRALPRPGSPLAMGAGLWLGADAGSPELRAARVKGSGTIVFADPVLVRRSGRRGERLRVRSSAGRRPRSGERPAARLALGAGDIVEVRG